MHQRLGIVALTFGQTPRVHYEVDFLRPLRFMDPVEIELSVEHVGRSSARYHFAVRSEGSMAAAGRYATAYVPRGSGRTQPWPDAVRDALLNGGNAMFKAQ